MLEVRFLSSIQTLLSFNLDSLGPFDVQSEWRLVVCSGDLELRIDVGSDWEKFDRLS